MVAVSRLLTFVDIDDRDDAGPYASSMSVTALHQAVLTDGRRIVLLDDRGWGATLRVTRGQSPSEGDERRRDELLAAGIWAHETVEELQREARTVVGPDEPPAGRSRAEMEAEHLQSLARTLRGHGVNLDAVDLQDLPHDVELSERVLARVGRGRTDLPSPIRNVRSLR